jgi:hypothetical protein
MTDSFSAEQPLAREALRLVASVQEWAQRTRPDDNDHPSDCQWCPLCQFAAVLRGERPDVTARVAEAGSAVVHAVRALLEAAADAADAAGIAAGARRDQPGAAEPPGHGAAGRPRVQRIDLSGEHSA